MSIEGPNKFKVSESVIQPDADGNLDMNNNKVFNMLNPVSSQDAATKKYVDLKYNGRNVFIGNSAGGSNTTGLGNHALGYHAMKANTSGTDNIAIGSYSLLSNISGNNNIGIGRNALSSNTNGINNTAICSTALHANTTGNYNFAIGLNALFNNTTGHSNIAFGENSLVNLTSGSNNIAFGGGSGKCFTSVESNNICIATTGNAGDNNTINIGNPSHLKCSINGIHNVMVSDGVPVFINSSHQLGTATSSIRFKENITDAKKYDINKLRVVNFNYKDIPDKPQIGLIAEEVEKSYPELVAYDNDGLPYTVRYMDLIPILLQKIQELEHKINYNH